MTTTRAATSTLEHKSGDGRTFLLHQHLQLIFHNFIPLGDVNVEGVVATRPLVCSLLPDFKCLQQAVPKLGGHVVNWNRGRVRGQEDAPCLHGCSMVTSHADSLIMVVPPASAALVPCRKSSMGRTPREGFIRQVLTSIPPGITMRPLASITLIPSGTTRFSPTCLQIFF